jgi:hypothetical protein
MFKCGNGEDQKWIKVKKFVDGNAQVFVLNDSGEIKAFEQKFLIKTSKKELWVM